MRADKKIPHISDWYWHNAIDTCKNLNERILWCDSLINLSESEKVKDKKREEDVLVLRGTLLQNTLQFREAVDSYTKALDIIPKGSTRYYTVLMNRGCANWIAGDLDSAVDDLQAIVAEEKADSLEYLDVSAYAFLSGISREIKRFDLAASYHNLAQNILETADPAVMDSLRWREAKCDLANEKGLYYLELEDFNKANVSLKRAEELAANTYLEGIALVNLGLLYMEQNRMDIALEYFNEASKKGDSYFGDILVGVNRIHIYIASGEYEKAKELTALYDPMIEIASHQKLLKSYYTNRTLIAENEGDIRSALYYSNRVDSLNQLSESNRQINSVSQKLAHGIENRVAVHKDSSGVNVWLIVICILSVVIIVSLAISLYRNRKVLRHYQRDNGLLQSALLRTEKDLNELENIFKCFDDKSDGLISGKETDSKNVEEMIFQKKLIILHSNLTKNELDLCTFLVKNLSAKEIANVSNRSVRTIESVKYSIKKKLGVMESTYNYLKRIDAMSLQEVRTLGNRGTDR